MEDLSSSSTTTSPPSGSSSRTLVGRKLRGLSSRKRFLNAMSRLLPQQVYKVVVNSGGKSWFIFRRYNEFHALHEKVRRVWWSGAVCTRKFWTGSDPSIRSYGLKSQKNNNSNQIERLRFVWGFNLLDTALIGSYPVVTFSQTSPQVLCVYLCVCYLSLSLSLSPCVCDCVLLCVHAGVHKCEHAFYHVYSFLQDNYV